MDVFKDGKPVKEEPKPEKPETSGLSELGGSEDVVKELKLRPYREFFETTPEEDGKLSEIIEFFGKGVKESEKVIEKIREIESSLNKDPFEKRITRLYRYVRLLRTIRNEVSEL